MATLKTLHRLSPFTGENGRYALGNVMYDAQRQRLIATDGRIAVLAPVEGNSCPDVMLPAKFLDDAIKPDGVEMVGDEKGVKIGRKTVPAAAPGNFPSVEQQVLPSELPNVLWCVNPMYLRKLAEYAEAAKADVIHFGVRAEQNKKYGMLAPVEMNSSEAGVSFFFYPENVAEPVTGILMPCELDDAARVREGFRKATSSGEPAGTAKPKSLPSKPAAAKAATTPKAAKEKPVKAEKPKEPRKPKEPKAPSQLFLERSIRSAADKGNIAVLENAVKYGVNVNAGDKAGYNALTRAALENQVAYIAKLIESGANVNHQPESKITALHTAAFFGHVEVVKLLLKHGAKVNVKDEDGDTPLDNAVNEEHAEIIKLLKRKA